ncbi:hypothetical protein J2S09_005049 [Bacillus fengqiuensis]|nr:hypothetical protein [Bacillus fengqiuensis]
MASLFILAFLICLIYVAPYEMDKISYPTLRTEEGIEDYPFLG